MKKINPAEMLKIFIVVLTLGMSNIHFAWAGLIEDVENLRNSLKQTDSARKELTLRLADLYFDEITEANKALEVSQTIQAKVLKYRSKAISLYIEALNGNGFYQAATSPLKWKISFQLARLYSDGNRFSDAKPFWEKLVAQNDILDLKREAALRLAENLESNQNINSYKKADEYYVLAIELCRGLDICSFAHYRRGWLLKAQGKLSEAISEMQLGLWDSKGTIREESLRDLVLFLSSDGQTNGQKELVLIENLAEKIGRPQLVAELSASFFSAGNKTAGVYVLEQVYLKQPTLSRLVKLLEENYGLRNWDRFRTLSLELSQHNAAIEDSENIEKILRRLTVQLDGQRMSEPQYTEDFKALVISYLRFFPKNKERSKMMEGWLAAEKNPDETKKMLLAWLESTQFELTLKEKINFREAIASQAQKLKDFELVVSQMGILSEISTDVKKQREYRYHQARALYELKKYDEALPLFKELSHVQLAADADQWAVQSQNLVMDILNQKKDFGAVATQANLWLQNDKISKASSLATEINDMQAIRDNALFEAAVTEGETLSALKTFYGFCSQNKLTPKSCQNAEVLSIKLNQPDMIIGIFKLLNKEESLMTEYEVRGKFFESAQLQEKLNLKRLPELEAYLKVALLYEISNQKKERNQILTALLRSKLLTKNFSKLEPLVYETLMDAGMLSTETYKFAWSESYHYKLADFLEENSKSNPQIRKKLLESKSEVGPAWRRLVLEKVKEYDLEQSKISFYGKNGQRKFENRIKKLKILVDFSEQYLSGALLQTRVEILSILTRAHDTLAQEVLNSPIPDGLDAESIEQVKASLAQLSAPFVDKTNAYKKLAEEQISQMSSEAERSTAQAKLNGDAIVSLSSSAKRVFLVAEITSEDYAQLQRAFNELYFTPQNKAVLSQIKFIYEKNHQNRLAAYFEGRLREGKGDIQ